MPSAKHQSLVRLLTEGHGVLRAVLTFVGIDVPEDLELRAGPDAMREGRGHDALADGTMVAYGTADRALRGAFVIEVQLARDRTKHYTWPLYVVVLRRRLRCPTTLVIVTDSETVARWASRPIAIGSGMVMRPVVIGPKQVPRDPSRAQCRKTPALAVLAVVAHGRGPEAERLGLRALQITRRLLACGDERGMLYLDVIVAYLEKAVLDKILEDEMPIGYQPFSPYLKRLRAEGRAEGMVRMLERLLEHRGLEPSDPQRRRMAECSDPTQLQRWFDRAFVATSVADILDT